MTRIDFLFLSAIGGALLVFGYGLGQRSVNWPARVALVSAAPTAAAASVAPAVPVSTVPAEPIAAARAVPIVAAAAPLPAAPVATPAAIETETPEVLPPRDEWGRLPDGTWIRHQRGVSALQSIGG